MVAIPPEAEKAVSSHAHRMEGLVLDPERLLSNAEQMFSGVELSQHSRVLPSRCIGSCTQNQKPNMQSTSMPRYCYPANPGTANSLIGRKDICKRRNPGGSGGSPDQDNALLSLICQTVPEVQTFG